MITQQMFAVTSSVCCSTFTSTTLNNQAKATQHPRYCDNHLEQKDLFDKFGIVHTEIKSKFCKNRNNKETSMF